jgi:hypothetical protein
VNYFDAFIKPDRYDKDGPIYCNDKVTILAIKCIQTSNYFTKRAKLMTTELEVVNQQVADYTKTIGNAIDNIVEQEKKLVDTVKTTSGKLRDATQKLSDGLSKVEKTANFDRLERYANTLERIEKAITVLAELEHTGKLEKIVKALHSK